jgi:hypothetical protein
MEAIEVFLREASTANPDLTVHRRLIEVMKAGSALATTGLLLDLVGRRASSDALLRRFRVARAKELLTIVQEAPDARSLLTADVLKPLMRDPDPVVQALTVRVAAVAGTMTDTDMSSLTELHQALWILQRAAVGDRNAVSSAKTLLSSDHAVTSLATLLINDRKVPDEASGSQSADESGIRAWQEDLEPDEPVARQILDVLNSRNSNS